MGNSGGWNYLTGANVSADFVGDSDWHDLTDGWAYAYDISVDSGYFKIGEARRFSYGYGPSQWFHTGNINTYWGALSGENCPTTDFIGDGGWYDLGNGWNYQHVGGDSGYFKIGDALQFSYFYVQSQWFHTTIHSDWIALSGTGLSAQFIGDGQWYNLGLSNAWWYHYDLGGRCGYWSRSADPNDYVSQRFYYSYTFGLWQHKGNYGDFNHLGKEGWWDPTFLGDGNNHWVDGNDNWEYMYYYSDDQALWTPGRTAWGNQYQYNYVPGEWWKSDSAGVHRIHGPGATTEEENPVGYWY